MAARKNKLYLTDTWKERIQISMLLNRLQDHARGKCEMSQTQVRAAEILLRKVAPDLASTDSTVHVKSSFIDLLKRIEEADNVRPQSQSTHTPRVTH